MKDFSIDEKIKWAEDVMNKNKDYTEHEVWVSSDFKESRESNYYSIFKDCMLEDRRESGYFKATLRIPKPERKVTITEGELRSLLNKNTNLYDENLDSFLEEIFGRGDE